RGNMITDGGLRKYDPCATADGADHALFAWSDDRDHISKQVYAGRAVPAGVPAAGWTTNGVRLAATSADQVTPAIAADAAGGAFVAWQDFRGVDADIYLQHVDSSGTVSAGWPALGFPVAALPGIQSAPVVAADDAGGVFVGWRDRRAGNDDVYLQHVGAGGSIAPGWTANGVAICSASGSQSVISIVRDGTGGVFVAWQDQRSVGLDIYATRIQSSGVLAAGWSAGG